MTIVGSIADMKDPSLTREDVAKLIVQVGSPSKLRLDGKNLTSIDLNNFNLSGASLRFARLVKANLTEANLSGSDLREAILTEAILTEAKLTRTDFIKADLRGAGLVMANLRESELILANLRGANLRGANLRGANLIGIDLRGAELTDADLREADLREARLNDVDLRGAILNNAKITDADFTGAIVSQEQLGLLMSSGAILTDIEFLPASVQTPSYDSLSNIIRIRLEEEPLTSHNVAIVLTAITEIYTKAWLLSKGRFTDFIDYTQTNNITLAKEANLVISTISYNSPLEINFSAPQTINAFTDAIAKLAMLGQTKKDAETKRKALEEEIKQKRREADSALAKNRQNLDIEARNAELERQAKLLELKEKELMMQMAHIDRVIELTKKLVEVQYPNADAATKEMAARAFLNNFLQLGEVKGLEVLPPGQNQNELPSPKLSNENRGKKKRQK